MRFKEDATYIRRHFGLLTMLRLVFWPRFLGHLGVKGQYYIKALLKIQKKMVKHSIEKYRTSSINFEERMPDDYTIWTCWWQGGDAMPDVIRHCHDSLLRNANGHNVVLVTKYNYRDFVDLPEWVLDKIRKGEISFSHFSDILRLSLLSKWGGCWIDAALFVTKPIQFSGLLYMPRLATMNNSLCQGKWCFGVMAGPKGFKVFRYMLDCLLEYWNKNTAAIDYLMFDGFLRIAYEEYNDVRCVIDHLPVSSPDLHSSRYTFSDAADKENLERLLSNNQFLSLTWRITYPTELPDGKETYYGALLKYAGNPARIVKSGIPRDY